MHNKQQRAQLATLLVLMCCMTLQVVVTDSIVVHLHRHRNSQPKPLQANILCCEVNMHSAHTYESQVRHHH